SVIGLVSGVDMAGRFDPQTQRMQQPWVVYQQAEQLFEVRNLGTSFVEIPEDVSLLWIVQPKNLSNDTLYAIDQFVMKGGKAIVFVDPVADVDPVAMEGMPQGMPPMGQGSDLAELFEAWGIEFSASDVVADAELALQISGMDRRPIRHYGYVGVTEDYMSADDIVTAEINVVHLATAGYLKLSEGSEATFEPLLRSSPVAQAMPASRFSYLPDPAALQDGFAPGGEEFVLAARVSGMLKSAFPNGPMPDIVSSDESDTAMDHVSESAAPVNLIVVADVDMLADHLWVQVQSFFGQRIANAFASNGAFVVNALENLSGSSDLIGVRSRASFTRPFTRVEALRVDAEARFQETEERLQNELDETERRLVELQSSREDSGNILMTEEQQDEIDRFIDQRASIRKELRAVQRGLDEDIERLGTRLKVINIGLVPVLLAAFALFAVWRRNRSAAA
ncbi:MAG: Gldg family protein, partial [Gammaproteobacteria bacterium]|nr:Gldg family protein [Gammaproteobacteria bacterium]